MPVLRTPQRAGQHNAGIARVVRFHHQAAGGASVASRALRVGEVEKEVVPVEGEVGVVWNGDGGRLPGHCYVARRFRLSP